MKTKYTGSLLIAVLMLMFAPGCAIFGSGKPVVTPARVKTVATLGAYFGTKAAIAKGQQAEVERALAGLSALRAAERPDIPAIFAALDAAQLTWLSSDEGRFTATAVAVFFQDIWTPTGQVALTEPLVVAFVDGLISGAEQALQQTKAARALAPGEDPVAIRLAAEAKATRK